MENYFCKTTEESLKEFNVSKEGLSSRQAEENLSSYGFNELNQKKKKSVLQVFFSQFKDLLIFILIAAGIISMLSDNVESTIVIFAVIILNAILGTVQHFKAEQSLDSVKSIISTICKSNKRWKKDRGSIKRCGSR